MIASLILALSLCAGLAVWHASAHAGLAILCFVLAGLGLGCLYSLMAWIFGWPRFKWDVVGAILDLLP